MVDPTQHAMSVADGHDPRAQQALDGAAVVLRPVVRWLLRHGVHYAALAQTLKQVFLAEARSELVRKGSKVTDSALSVLSGVHRKDVRALSAEALPVAPLVPTPASVLFTRWVTDVRYRDPVTLHPRALLPRQGDAPSFEALARETSSDVHPRTLLEELQRLGMVTVEGDHVALASERFVSRPEDANAAQTLAVNAADHLSAAVYNLQPRDGFRFLEQSVYANGLSEDSGRKLAEAARALWTPAFDGMVAAATDCVRADNQREDTPLRMRFGVYYYHEAAHPAVGDAHPEASRP
ncbi:MAG: DUF6502 family protein [Leptothrix sp. (in: b-proteobacteria)]